MFFDGYKFAGIVTEIFRCSKKIERYKYVKEMKQKGGEQIH